MHYDVSEATTTIVRHPASPDMYLIGYGHVLRSDWLGPTAHRVSDTVSTQTVYTVAPVVASNRSRGQRIPPTCTAGAPHLYPLMERTRVVSNTRVVT